MEIESAALRDLHSYWEGKRKGRNMPSRSDIDPTEIPKMLPSILLMDVEAESGRLKVRLVGTVIVELYGADYTGRYLDEIDFGDRRDQILKDYSGCVTSCRPGVSKRLFWNLRGVHLNVERLILPLSDDRKAVNMLLAAIAFKRL